MRAAPDDARLNAGSGDRAGTPGGRTHQPDASAGRISRTHKRNAPGTFVPGSGAWPGFPRPGSGLDRPPAKSAGAARADQLAARREREPALAALPTSAAAFRVALVAAAKFDSAALAAWRAALVADS